jgi:hypothetical protein
VAANLVGGLKCRTQFWKGTTQGSFQQSLVEIGSVVSEEKIFFLNFIPLFSIFSLVAILVGSRDDWTQFWKGTTQRPFHQSLVAIGPVVLEELIKMQPEALKSLYRSPGYKKNQLVVCKNYVLQW